MATSLTAAAVERYKKTGKRRVIRDGGAKSLYLVIQPSGHKSWLMRFRTPGGRIGKVTLGPVHSSKEPPGELTIGMPLTLAGARQLAAVVHRERQLGHDPVEDNKTRKLRQRTVAVEGASNTFGVAAKDFLEKYASKKVRRWYEQARLLGFQPTASGLEVIPGGLAQRWGDRPVAKIDGHDIHGIIAETRERGAPGLKRRSDKPTETRARAMLSCLSRMFRWLLQHRRVETNPCAGVHRPETPKARDRVLSNAEIARFWAATDAMGAPFGAVLKLLLLTGCRLNEIAALRWDELSDDGAALHLPGSRTKNHRAHVVPLAPMARAILASVQRIEGCPLAFSTNGRTAISGWSKCKRHLDTAMGNPPPWRLHDLRRTAVTGMAELGIRPDVIELAVNHISGTRGGIAGVYNRAELLSERKLALERWATHVAGIVSGQPANVTPLPRKGRGS